MLFRNPPPVLVQINFLPVRRDHRGRRPVFHGMPLRTKTYVREEKPNEVRIIMASMVPREEPLVSRTTACSLGQSYTQRFTSTTTHLDCRTLASVTVRKAKTDSPGER